jgi:hypothetical protein
MPCQDLDGAEGDAGLDELATECVAEGVDRSGEVGAAEGAAEGACQGEGGYLGEDELAGAAEGFNGLGGAFGDGDDAPLA